ncbi:TetR/AcrR family transcriptional regulator [Streptomyces sp. BBFR115]|uniref:TetR/AcrR family transcriptional regulator n=1 Tax=Streptomyces sp. BBFR115 TaxID=3448173 RepID=UPI003F759B08
MAGDSAAQVTARRRRDPAGRRREIVEAAAALVIEVGLGGLTHRMVANRAQVALGSTTHYFATLDDLREAALRHLADQVDSGLAEVKRSLDEHGADPAVLAEALFAYLADTHLVRADTCLLSAAVIDPHFRSLALQTFDRLVALMSAYVGVREATAIAVFAQGAAAHAALHEEPLDVASLTEVITRLLAATGECAGSGDGNGNG